MKHALIMHHPNQVCLLILMVDSGDRLCGLVIRVLGYRSGGPGSIPDTTRKRKEE
jgi:hypothetical protein